MNNYGNGATTEMINEMYKEPKGPFDVEIMLCGKTELWNVKEIQDYQEAVSEAQVLADHGFGWRIVGAEGRYYTPNLKPRKAA